jgi:hypothetical protein
MKMVDNQAYIAPSKEQSFYIFSGRPTVAGLIAGAPGTGKNRAGRNFWRKTA